MTRATSSRLAMPDLLARSASQSPERLALVNGDLAISYDELERRTATLASVLSAIGIGVDDVVALALPRSADLTVAMFAVLKAGAAFLPVDVGYPAERIAFMCADSAVSGPDPVAWFCCRPVWSVTSSVGA